MTGPEIAFYVIDTPRPQGSKKHVGHGVMVESGGQPLRSWREAVKQAALDNLPKDHTPFDGPVGLSVWFYMPRPRSHYRTGRNAMVLRDQAPAFPHRTPDLDKLLRSSCDAITAAGVWTDDARLVTVTGHKRYCSRDFWATPGARFRVWEQAL